MVNEAVDCGDGDSLVGEDLVPGAEGLVGRDGEASGLVAPCDQLEEDRALGLIFLGIGDVIEDDEIGSGQNMGVMRRVFCLRRSADHRELRPL